MTRAGVANAALLSFTLLVGTAVWWLELRPPLRVDVRRQNERDGRDGDDTANHTRSRAAPSRSEQIFDYHVASHYRSR